MIFIASSEGQLQQREQQIITEQKKKKKKNLFEFLIWKKNKKKAYKFCFKFYVILSKNGVYCYYRYQSQQALLLIFQIC